MQEVAEQPIDYVSENSVGDFDFERPFEIANENEMQLSDEEVSPELLAANDIDPVGEAIRPYVGEQSETVTRAENIMEIKDGELVDNNSGLSLTRMLETSGSDADRALHQDMMRQWQEGGSNFFVNPILEPEYFPGGERYFITTMILEADGKSVSYETRTITTLYKDEDETPARDNEYAESSSQQWSEHTGSQEIEANYPQNELAYMEQAAAVTVEEPESADTEAAITTTARENTQSQLEANVPTTMEVRTESEKSIEYSYAEIAHPREIQAQILGEFLAMEQLPAIPVEDDFNEPIILKAPEPAQDILNEAQRVEHSETNRAPVEIPTNNVPRFVETQTSEVIFEQAEIVQELAEQPEVTVQIKTEVPRTKPAATREVQRIDVQDAELPTYDFKDAIDEIREVTSVVIEQQEKPVVKEITELKPEVKTVEPQIVEIFRGRRGARPTTESGSSRSNHEERAEELRTEPQSIAERAVEQTLERFAAEMIRARPTQQEDAHREPFVELNVRAANEHDLVVEADEQALTTREHVRVAEKVAPIILEQKPTISSETRLPDIPETRTDESLHIPEEPAAQPHVTAEAAPQRTAHESGTVVPFPDLARPETRAASGIEHILEQLRLPRSANTPEVIRAANENLRTSASSNLAMSDDADNQPRTRTVKSGPITMRIAA